jgi:hypothetical protein
VEFLQCGPLVEISGVELAAALLNKMEAFAMLGSVGMLLQENPHVGAEYKVSERFD